MTLLEILAALGGTATAASATTVAIVRARSRRADAHDDRDAAREERVEKLEAALDEQRVVLTALVQARLDDRSEHDRELRASEDRCARQLAAAKSECAEQIQAVEARSDRLLAEVVHSIRRAGLLREDDTGVHHVEDVIRRARLRRTTPPAETRYIDPDDQ